MSKLDRLIRKIAFLRYLFITKDDEIIIAQAPNVPIWIGGALFTASQIVDPEYKTLVDGGLAAAVAIWSIEEIGWGVNNFRRLLGAGVLIFEVRSIVHRLSSAGE